MSGPFFDATRREFLAGAAAGFFLSPNEARGSAAEQAGTHPAWTFYRSGSSDVALVYADPLATQALGHRIMADQEGRFPAVFLAPGQTYRAVLTHGHQAVVEIDPVDQMTANLVRYGVPSETAVPRSVASKLAERVSVLDFGADPSGRFDSLAAIRTAIDYAYPNNRELYFPTGVYLHSRPLAFGRAGFSVRGEGYCVLRHTGSANHCVSIDAGPTSIQYGARLENLVIEGNGVPQQNGLWMRNWGRSALRDIFVRNVTGQAFRLEGVVSTHFDFCRVVEDLPYRHVPTHAWYVTGSDPAYIGSSANCTFTNCLGKAASQYGLYLDRCDACLFHGGAFEGLPGIGIHIGPTCVYNNFVTVFAEANGRGDIICHGSRNIFTGVVANSRSRNRPYTSLPSIVFKSGATGNIMMGGQAFSVALERGADRNRLGIHTLAELEAGEAGILDSATGTRIER